MLSTFFAHQSTRPSLASQAGLAGLLFLLLLALSLTSCGGGGGKPDPQISYPPAVEELTEDDFLAAGIPALPQASSAVSAAVATDRSSSAGAECERTESVAKNEYISIHNLVPTSTGFVTDVPESNTSRIIAWVMYELPALEGERVRSISFNFDKLATLRVFAAVSNFSRGRWEPGRMLDGNPDRPIIIGLSPGQRYNRADGPGYLLLAVGHPGNGQMSGLQIKLEDILISSFDVACMSEGFESQMVGAVDWGDGNLRYIGETEKNQGPVKYLLRQDFGQTSGDSAVLLLPQPLNLISSPEYFDFQSLSGDWNGDGIDTIGYFDPGDLNGPRHPFQLHAAGDYDGDGDVDGADYVTAVPLPELPGLEPNSIIAILIGLLGQPLAGVNVELRDSQNVLLRTALTNARGEFILNFGAGGDFPPISPGEKLSLSFARTGTPNLPSYTLSLMEEEGIFFMHMGAASDL